MTSFTPTFEDHDFIEIPDGTVPPGSPDDFYRVWPLREAFGSLESEEMAYWLMLAMKDRTRWMAVDWTAVANVLTQEFHAGKENWLFPSIIHTNADPKYATVKGFNELIDGGFLARQDTDDGTFVWPTQQFLDRLERYKVTADN